MSLVSLDLEYHWTLAPLELSTYTVMHTYMTISVKAPKRAYSLTELESANSRTSHGPQQPAARWLQLGQ